MKNLLPPPKRHPSPANGNGRPAPTKPAEIGKLFMKVARDVLYVDDSTSDLPLRQLRICTALVDGPRTMSQLGRELRVSLSAMTQIADRLERSGLVMRVADEADRRVRCLQLTPRGLRAMRAREELRLTRVGEVFSKLSPAERVQIAAALETLARVVTPIAPVTPRSAEGSGMITRKTSP
jgi:DNA-binding MarR family transcriptional regulator